MISNYKSVSEKMLLWFTVIVSVFVTDNFLTTVYIDSRISTYSNAFIVAFSLLFIFTSVYINKGKIIYDSNLCWIVFVTISIVLSCIINNSNVFASILKIALFLISLFVSREYSLKQFSSAYLKVLDIILITTLVLNLLFMFGIDFSFLPRIVSTKGVVYYWGVLGNIHANSRSNLLRISGIWMEPGVCASYIIVGILFELYLSKKMNTKRMLLYCVSLLMTFSTTGFISFILILLAKLFEVQNRNYKQKFIISILVVLVIVLAFSSETINSMLIGKILGQEESFKDRYYSINGNIIAFFKNPIFGLGTIKSSEIIKDYLISHGVTRSFSNLNTPLAYYSVFGIVPGLYFTRLIFGFPSKFSKSKISKFMILLTFLLILSSSNYLFSLLFTVIFFLENENNSSKLCKENLNV